MPKSLNIYSNQRIDKPDFELGTRTYAQDLRSHLVEVSKISNFSRVLRGFRVEIEDQSVNPGQITIHSGVSLDRSGRVLHIEDQPDASLTTTLSGATQTFYLEIEFSETPSDLDSRGFWDPTVDNVDPIPDGGEVNVSVSTRLTPSWTIVTPISTTGFTYEATPNSTRVPIAVLSTNASNEIDSSVNLFSTLEFASTTLSNDIAALDTTLSLVDSSLFPVGAEITIDLGGSSPETARTILSNDLENGIITVSPAVVGSHLAGAIVRRTDVGTNTFLPLEENPNSPDFDAVTAATRPNDYQKRFYSGDERRGSALITSEKTFGERNDLKLYSEKDFVDATSAIIRDLKFGNPRADITSSEPPTSFPTYPRYYDRVGSLAGARTHTVTIGDGTTSFGDFNGTDETPFLAAVAFLSAGGSIFVKKGTYTFANPVAISSNVSLSIVGEVGGVVLDNAQAAGPALTFTGPNTSLSLENISTSLTGGYTHFLASSDTANLQIKDSSITGFSLNIISSLVIENSTISDTIVINTVTRSFCTNNTFTDDISVTNTLSNVTFVSCNFQGISAAGIANSNFKNCFLNSELSLASFTDSVIENCETSGGTLTAPLLSVTGVVRNISLNNCSFSIYADTVISVSGGGLVSYLSISNCSFTAVDPSAQISAIIDFGTSEVKNSSIENSYFYCPVNCSGTAITGGIKFYDVTDVSIKNCLFQTASSLNTTSVNVAISVSLRDSTAFSVENCTFTQATSTEFTHGIVCSGISDMHVNNCEFTRGSKAIWLTSSNISNDTVSITNCVFYHNAALSYFAIHSQGTQTLDLLVKDCFFSFAGISGASLNRLGVFFENSSSNLLVEGNTFTDFGLNSTAGTYGVYADTSAANSSISVINNLFTDFIGVENVGAVNIFPTDGQAIISGNTIKNFDYSGTTVSCLFVSGASSAIIANNHFSNVVGSDDASGTGTCIGVNECINTSITENSCIECTDRSIISTSYTGLSSDPANVNITGNIIDIVSDTRTSVTVSGIVVSTSTAIATVCVSNNNISMTDSCDSNVGIDIGNGSGYVARATCSGNTVFLHDGEIGILVDASHAAITGNTVGCNTGGIGAPHTGISLAATLGGMITGNTISSSSSIPAVGYYNITASGTGAVGIYSNFAWETAHPGLVINNTSTGGAEANNL